MAVWHAFDSESRGREDYQRIRGALDKQNFKLILSLCEQIINGANKQSEISARAIANAISGITDEVWKEILFAGESYDRDDARKVCLSFLASIFPWCYTMPAEHSSENQACKLVEVTRATSKDVSTVARLFDQYRQFYQQNPDEKLAANYIEERISTDSSVIFLAWCDNKAVGFTQLYATYCSVDATPIWVLYDLFVDGTARRLGAGKALMNRALEHARQTGASRIDLETATDNVSAQHLYESLGYVRDTGFYKYSLEI